MATDLLDATAEELDNADLYEIIDGVKVEMPPMSAESSLLASRLAAWINIRTMPNDLGEAHCEILVRLPLPVDRNRRPDIIYVPYTLWPRNRRAPRSNAWDVLPALCVEVVSPTDLVEELTEKISEYFRAGVSQVWVIHPRQQRVDVYESSALMRGLFRGDTLVGGNVLPGFTLALSELFPEPEPSGNGT